MTPYSANLNQPIPNNPFYSPASTYLCGPYHPWISAAGNCGFDFSTGVFEGGGGTPTPATPGTPGAVYGSTTSTVTALGENALLNNSIGVDNTAVGTSSLCSNTSGGYNVAIGGCSLCSNVEGSSNVSIGSTTLFFNTSGSFNVAVGDQALMGNTVGCYNTAIGGIALNNNVAGTENVAVGFLAAISPEGSCNTALGVCSMASAPGLGFPRRNTAVGHSAMIQITSGCNNVALGYRSGGDSFCTITNQSNRVVLGNNDTTQIVGKVAYTNASDIRVKKVHGNVPLSLPFLQSLTPIKYQFCDPETGRVLDDQYRYGFSAQEIIANEEVPAHPIIAQIDNPNMYTLTETMLIPVLVNAIKDLSDELSALKAEVAALKQQG